MSAVNVKPFERTIAPNSTVKVLAFNEKQVTLAVETKMRGGSSSNTLLLEQKDARDIANALTQGALAAIVHEARQLAARTDLSSDDAEALKIALDRIG